MIFCYLETTTLVKPQTYRHQSWMLPGPKPLLPTCLCHTSTIKPSANDRSCVVSSSAIAGLATSIFKLQKHPINTSKIGDLTLITSTHLTTYFLLTRSCTYLHQLRTIRDIPSHLTISLHLTEKYIIGRPLPINQDFNTPTIHTWSAIFSGIILVLLRDLDCEAFMH